MQIRMRVEHITQTMAMLNKMVKTSKKYFGESYPEVIAILEMSYPECDKVTMIKNLQKLEDKYDLPISTRLLNKETEVIIFIDDRLVTESIVFYDKLIDTFDNIYGKYQSIIYPFVTKIVKLFKPVITEAVEEFDKFTDDEKAEELFNELTTNILDNANALNDMVNPILITFMDEADKDSEM